MTVTENKDAAINIEITIKPKLIIIQITMCRHRRSRNNGKEFGCFSLIIMKLLLILLNWSQVINKFVKLVLPLLVFVVVMYKKMARA